MTSQEPGLSAPAARTTASRRQLLKTAGTAAWAAPVVVVVAGAPASAVVSGGPALSVVDGTTSIAPWRQFTAYDALNFESFEITPTSSIPVGQLSMVLSASKDGQPLYLFGEDGRAVIPGWSSSDTTSSNHYEMTWVYGGEATPTAPAVADGEPAAIMGSGSSYVYGATVTVAVSAMGYPTVTRQFTSTR